MRKSLLIVVAALVSVVRSAGAQVPVPGFTVVAESGEQAAGQSSGVTYSSPTQPCLGESGQVVFVTDLFGGGIPNLTTAIYAGQPGAVQPVAREGLTAPGTGNATWANLLGAFRIARGSDQIAFDGTIAGADPAHDGGIWAGLAASLALVRREGDPVPGLPGVVYADMAGITRIDPSLNGAGSVAFRAFLAGGGATETNDEALFMGTPGSIVLVAREGDAAPGAGGATFVDSGAPVDSKDTFGAPSINGGGRILFRSHLAGAGVTGANAQGVWHGPANGVSLAVRAGDPAPGLPAGRFFRTFELAVLNDADQIAVVSLTADTLGFNQVTGVWLGAPGSLTKLAAQGDPAPSDPDSATFGAVYEQLRSNGTGQAAFLAALSNAQWGVYGYDPTQGLRLLARSDTPAPGIAGQEFTPGSNDWSVFLNDQGKVLFRGTTSPSAIVGLWIADVATGQVDLLARTGAPAEVDGTMRTFENISLAVGASDDHEGGAQDGRASPLGDDGNVTFSTMLEGTQPAVVRTGTGGGGVASGCTDIASCRAALAAALPDPAQAADKKARKVAKQLAALFKQIGRLLDKAATLTGAKQAKRYAAAKSRLDRLVSKATVAEGKGRLGVPLAALSAAANALESHLP